MYALVVELHLWLYFGEKYQSAILNCIFNNGINRVLDATIFSNTSATHTHKQTHTHKHTNTHTNTYTHPSTPLPLPKKEKKKERERERKYWMGKEVCTGQGLLLYIQLYLVEVADTGEVIVVPNVC